MTSDFRHLIERAGSYEFDPKQLDAIPITGILRKSRDPESCILVVYNGPSGDLVMEIAADDVVRHEVEKSGEHTGLPGDQVKLYVRPTAVVTTSFSGKVTNSLITAFLVNSIFGQAIREPLPEVSWRELVTPFSRIDVMFNMLDSVAWAECRARGKEECERLHPPGVDRDRCITERYIACGPPPRLRVSERVLEQLVELFRGPPGPPEPPI